MDFTPDVNTISVWLMQYGGIVLFVLLTLGIIILPVPEETMMIVTGILLHKGSLPIFSTIIAAFLGALSGISISYLLGKTTGHFLVEKYGKRVGLTKERFKKTHDWFNRFGKWTLLIGYFVPGIRHLTGLSAGTSGLVYKKFALYAYTGAIIWVSTFLSIGYFFGKSCLSFYEKTELTLDMLLFILIPVALFVGLYIYKKKKQKKHK